MSVKKVMPKGGRKSSPTLWAMVRALTDEEWQIIAFIAEVRFKDTLQFKLLNLLRSMEAYDPVAEKATFAANDLKSMRKTAKRWLLRTASRLGFHQTEVAQQVIDVDALIGWGIHDDTMEFIAEAKQLAKEQEEFGWLSILYKKELKAASIIFQGAERIEKMAAIMQEALENGRLVALDAEIDQQHTVLVEKIRNDLLTNGNFDKGLAENYFKGKFHRQQINEWPISFQIRKLRIDEAIHYFMGDPSGAANAAEKLLPLIEKFDIARQQRSEEHPKCLYRLSAYYTEFQSKSKVFQIVERFRRLAFHDSSYNYTYLRRFIYTLFSAAFQFDTISFADEGLEVWKEHFELFNRIPKDGIRFTTLLCVLAFQLSKGDHKDARMTFGLASEVAEHFPHLIYQSVLKIFHLMILLDEDDERGLQSYGKNYKRHLNAFLKVESQARMADAALEIVTILAKESNLQGKSKLRDSLKKTIQRLQRLHHATDMNFTPFVYPMVQWAELRLSALLLPVGNDDDI
jgi:hypothetical protein